jgi:acyl-coenzyme A thioesterase PaaI-like protein
MAEFTPPDPDFAQRVRASFGRQAFMALIGATIDEVAPGWCRIRLPYRPDLSQQHGFFHAGVIGTIADNCGGYSAFTPGRGRRQHPHRRIQAEHRGTRPRRAAGGRGPELRAGRRLSSPRAASTPSRAAGGSSARWRSALMLMAGAGRPG